MIIEMNMKSEKYCNLYGNAISDDMNNISVLINYCMDIFELFYLDDFGYFIDKCNRFKLLESIEFVGYDKYNKQMNLMNSDLFSLMYEISDNLGLIKPKLFFDKAIYEFEKQATNQPKVLVALRDFYERECI